MENISSNISWSLR